MDNYDDDVLDSLDGLDFEDEDEGAGDEGSGGRTPAPLTEAEQEAIAKAWLDRNRAYLQGQFQPTPPPPAPRQEDDDDDETVAGVIRKEVRDAVQKSFGSFRDEFANQTGNLAKPMLIDKAQRIGNLNEDEMKELQIVVDRMQPAAYRSFLEEPEGARELAALAKGRAQMNAASLAAPVAKSSSKLQWASWVTQDQLDKYKAFRGISELSKEHVEELVKEGYVKRTK